MVFCGLNPGVGNRPVISYAHLSQVDRFVMSIGKGVKPVNATSAEKKLLRKRSFPLYISNRRGLTLCSAIFQLYSDNTQSN